MKMFAMFQPFGISQEKRAVQVQVKQKWRRRGRRGKANETVHTFKYKRIYLTSPPLNEATTYLRKSLNTKK